METYNSFQEGLKSGKRAFKCKKNVKDTDETFMTYAIQIARQSTSNDKDSVTFMGKVIPQPKIGAVLVLGDAIYCSARSGIEQGDHAEFTVIDTLCKGLDLSSAKFYSTLEPCTPESRHDWTKSCSKLIQDRGIKEIYIGTLDANPLIFGIGTQDLLEHGVKVSFFPQKFRNELTELNKDFFAFCKAYPDAKTIKEVDRAIGQYINPQAVAIYNKKKTTSADDMIILYRKLLLGGRIDKNAFGLVCVDTFTALTFFKNPSVIINGYNTGIIDERDKASLKTNQKKRTLIDESILCLCSSSYKGNIFYKLLELLVGEKNLDVETLNNLMKVYFSDPKIIRELIINAFVHNDYSSGCGVTFEIYNGYILITNYANKLSESDEKKLVNKTMKSLPLNPPLMQYFSEANLVDNTNVGMGSIQKDNTSNLYKFEQSAGQKMLYTYIKTKK